MNPNWEDINFVLLPYDLKPQNYLDDTSFLKKIFIKGWNTFLLCLARASNLFGNYSALQQESTTLG